MNIAATQFDLEHHALEIYISGCDGYCDKVNKSYILDGHEDAKCQNPELWDYNIGKSWTSIQRNIISKVIEFSDVIDKIVIFGGEPLLQDLAELVSFLAYIKDKTNKEIWLFTRFEFEDVPENIKIVCDRIKCGLFDYSKRTENHFEEGYQLASTNQHIRRST